MSNNNISESHRIAVVIPSYRVTKSIINVIKNISSDICKIYVIDDACPDGSGKLVEDNLKDKRIHVIYHEKNQGVGGAVMTGYQAAIDDDAEIIIKIDGDGQMDPSLIPSFIEPILSGDADYTKGNRFYDLDKISAMPASRLFGNAILSFMNKLSSGYWNIFDPTNGYTAIHVNIAKNLPFKKISRRYFFESDMLFRLNTLRAVITDIPMNAKYGDETSHLNILQIIGEFFFKHFLNFFKRIFYNYYLRDISLASIELPIGIILFLFGIIFGSYHWVESIHLGETASAGTVMLAAMPILMGLQLILAFIGYDISATPSQAIHQKLRLLKK